jgi:hypothetical protein
LMQRARQLSPRTTVLFEWLEVEDGESRSTVPG